LVFGLGVLLIVVVGLVFFGMLFGLVDVNVDGNVMGIVNFIFGKYVWVFEVISVLLIIVVMGLMVLVYCEWLGVKCI